MSQCLSSEATRCTPGRTLALSGALYPVTYSWVYPMAASRRSMRAPSVRMVEPGATTEAAKSTSCRLPGAVATCRRIRPKRWEPTRSTATMTGTLSPVPLAPEPGERDRLGEKHAAGLPDRWRGGRVNDEARIEPGSLLHLEGAPRTGTEWASTIPIIPGQGHLSGQRHELTPPRHETARLTAQRYVLVLIPFQSLVDLLNAVVGPHPIQPIEVRID